MRHEILKHANPWWSDPTARPMVPPPLPGDLRLDLRPPAIDLVHAAPRAGTTTWLLRTVADALDAGHTATFVPADASATWGTEAVLEGFASDHMPKLIAIDRPMGENWPGYLKMMIDSGSSLAGCSILIATAGLREATDIAGTLAGRQGTGRRHLLLPRRFRDVVELRRPGTLRRATEAAGEAGDDLVAFSRALQLSSNDLEEAWQAYALLGALPPALSTAELPVSESMWSASRSIVARSGDAATEAATILGEVKADRAISLTALAGATRRSHSWVRLVDQRAVEALVWFRVRQVGRPRGAPRRVLVDPAYAKAISPSGRPEHWEALARSIWRTLIDDQPDRARAHGLEWQRPDHEILTTPGWVLQVTGSDPIEDRRRLRPLRTLAARGLRTVRATAGAIDLVGDPIAVPAWTIALAGELGVVSWSKTS